MNIRTESREEKAERTKQAVETLGRLLKPGDRVYTTLLHVSRSGMLRSIKVVVPYTRGVAVPGERPDYAKLGDLDLWDISGLVARVIGARFDDQRGGIFVSGGGMDTGFWIVYQLGHALYPKGFKTWEGYWRNEPMDFDPDGGYAFRHVWL